MIDRQTHTGEGFRVLCESGEWKIGFLHYCERFSACTEMERHRLTDESFVLLAGRAILYTEQEQIPMAPETLYTVPAGEWHHIVVSPDAAVMVVENRNTARENTEKKYIREETHDANQ